MTERPRYRPSGRVDLPPFVLLGGLWLAVAGGLGWLLWHGWENAFWAPLLFVLGAAVAVGALGLLVVRGSRCRSPALALALGVAAGALVHPGQFAFPWLEASRAAKAEPGVRGFVRFVDARFGAAALAFGTPWPRLAEPGEEEPTRADHWVLRIVALLELLLVPVITAAPLAVRCRREPFCERCGRWAEEAFRLGFSSDARDVLIEGLSSGRLPQVAGATVTEIHPNTPNLLGVVHVCDGAACTGPGGWLTLRSTDGDAASRLAFEALFPWWWPIVRCVELDRGEVSGLRELVPGDDAGGTRRIAPTWLEDLEELATEEGDDVAPPELATIESVALTHLPPAVDARVRRWADWVDLAVLAGFALAGFGLIWWASGGDGDAPIEGPLLLAGFLLMAAGLPVVLRDRQFYAHRWVLRKLAPRLRGRVAARVRFEDPDALPVALVPRSVWSTRKGLEKIDFGALAVRGEEILVETDRLRIRIPVASVRTVTTESLVVDQYSTLWFVVLEVAARDGVHTLPFMRIGAPLGETLFRSSEKRCGVLLERVMVALS